MTKTNYIALLAVTLAAFILSSVYYSPLVFGKQFLALSGFATPPRPSVWKAACELLRTLLLAFVISRVLIAARVQDVKGALTLGVLLWLGFPFVLLTGSILWQGAPIELAAIHSGDWLIKLLLIPVTLSFWPKRSPTPVS